MRNLLMTSFLSIFYLTQFTAHASDGNIKFTGEIIQSSCTFRALTKDQTVSLGIVATNSFKKYMTQPHQRFLILKSTIALIIVKRFLLYLMVLKMK